MPAPTPAAPSLFERCIELTLGYEGEESNDPHDPGGLTRWGIAQKWHPTVDVAKLTRGQAIDLLERLYWFPIRGDLLPWPLVAAVFDHAVNSGPGVAIRALQDAVGTPSDGLLGPHTREALAEAWAASPRAVVAAVLRSRVAELAAAKGAARYLGGWMARVADLSGICGYELGQIARARAA